ncbi:MAG: metal-dependent transcriptional regulator [Deltaproteobacteria bacterium]|nr:metal-dependent transcriptional regulator [Deltaproteobacteria bacterium]MBW2068228.1 metal-dependent transcriptional regulator [Deltaproteobacteria bacterium]
MEMPENNSISASLEDYLEIIYQLQKKHKVARAKAIADKMKVQKASVTGALKSLAAKGLINYEPYSTITLTQKGEKIAKQIIHRHEILKEFFQSVLQLSPEQAEVNACKIEHVIHPKAVQKLTKFLEFLKICPRAGSDWVRSFENYCQRGAKKDECEQCLIKCLEQLRRT